MSPSSRAGPPTAGALASALHNLRPPPNTNAPRPSAGSRQNRNAARQLWLSLIPMHWQRCAVNRKKLTAFGLVLIAALAAGCASKSPEPPLSVQTCPAPQPLPAWVIEADPVASLPWFERGCELGDGQGCRLRGEQLAKESPPGCETAARAWFEKGTSAGDAMSFNEIGFLEDHCPNGDKAAARRAFGAACEGGEPIGCRNQAMLLDKGAGGPADPKAAADLHERACRATERIADSCVDAGFFRYAHDAEAVALELFRLGCDSGAAVGCRNAAVVLRDSRTAKDPKGAREMFERACSGGDAPSCREIGAPMPGR